MNYEIRHLRNVSLSQELALQLASVISAYRPHTEPDINKEDRIKKEETTLEEITRLMKKQSYYKSEYIKRENQKAYVILSEMYYNE
jgi:hypothetical protein